MKISKITDKNSLDLIDAFRIYENTFDFSEKTPVEKIKEFIHMNYGYVVVAKKIIKYLGFQLFKILI